MVFQREQLEEVIEQWSGLFYKLEPRLHFEEDELVFFASRLNEIEFESVDAPPLFGARRSHNNCGLKCSIIESSSRALRDSVER